MPTRTFIDGNGNDSTAAAIAFLLANRGRLILPDLYVIRTAPNLEGAPGTPFLGPYAGLAAGVPMATSYFDPASRTLYWIAAITNVGNYWGGYSYDLGCGVPGPGGVDPTSFTVTINILTPDLNLRQVTTGPLPCSFDGGPNGVLIVAPDNFWIGSASGYGYYRWHRVGLDGSYSPCPFGPTFGKLTYIGDDNWGADGEEYYIGNGIGVWSDAFGALLHISAANTWLLSGGIVSGPTLPNSWSAAAVATPAGVWVLSNSEAGNPYLSLITSASSITNYALPNSPPIAEAHANDIEFYAADNSLLFWLGDVLYKWDIASQTILDSAAIPYSISGPIQEVGSSEWLPNGLKFYDPVYLTEVFDATSYAPGLPSWVNGVIFKHMLDGVGERLWLQADDGNVYGVQWGAPPDYLGAVFNITDYPSSLVYNPKGQFFTGNISRGEVESKIGFEADTLDITWSPKATDLLGGRFPVLQAFTLGLFDNAICEVWRCVMPNAGDLVGSPEAPARLGDCNTLGAALMFQGRIGDVKPDRLSVTFTLISRMETLNIEVPTNLIEPTNILAAYSVGVEPAGGAPLFTVTPGSTTQVVYASPQTPTDIYDQGYIIFQLGSDLAGIYARILEQKQVGGVNAFYLTEPLPEAPSVGDLFKAYGPMPINTTGAAYFGFRWVPSPDNSAVII